MNCVDCGVPVGQAHEKGCDVARCSETGMQRIGCDDFGCCALTAGLTECPNGCHDCGNDTWTGEWPGVSDAARLGLWCFWGPDYGQQGWVKCGPDHPGAREDLNRLYSAGRWNRETRRWDPR